MDNQHDAEYTRKHREQEDEIQHKVVAALGSWDALRVMMRTSITGDRHIDWHVPEDSGMILVEGSPVESFAANGTAYLPVLPNYPHIRSEKDILCADLLHVAASKYNCVANRCKGRDIYDMAYMVEENILPQAWQKYIENSNGYMRGTHPSVAISQINNQKEDFRKAWEKDEIGGYITDGSDFDACYDVLKEHLNWIWDSV